MYGAASTCPDTLWDEIKKEFGIEDVITGFGMTELAGAVMQTPACAPSYVLQKSVGRPLSYRKMSADQSEKSMAVAG